LPFREPAKPLDIGTWLRGLGLEHYEAAFRDNDVDAVTRMRYDGLFRKIVANIREHGSRSVLYRSVTFCQAVRPSVGRYCYGPAAGSQ